MEQKEERVGKPSKKRSLLSRLASWSSSDDAPKQKKNQLRRANTTIDEESQPRPPTFGPILVPPRWTPPLSPSKSMKHSSFSAGEHASPVLSPRGALKVLNSPGVPPLDDLRQMRMLVGAASRSWLRDFLIRGGRRCVNAKVSEMAALEKEAKKRPRRVALMPVVFGRKSGNGNDNGDSRGKGKGKGGCGLLPRPTLREIAEAREELMKLVVFLHLRE